MQYNKYIVMIEFVSLIKELFFTIISNKPGERKTLLTNITVGSKRLKRWNTCVKDDIERIE